MSKNKNWKLLKRKKVYGSKFVNVYEDKIELTNGSIIDDYTVIEKPSVVIVVATDKNNHIIVLREYKYAAGETLLSLPAGHKKKDEQPIDAARRELLEETGFGGNDFEELGMLYDYPTKDLHKVYVIRAKNVVKKGDVEHEETEMISYQSLTVDELKNQIKNKEWKGSSALASITFSGILF